MIFNSFEINEALRLDRLSPEQTVDASQHPEARIWIDLHNGTIGEVESWLDKLGTSELSGRLCVEACNRAGYYPLKREIVLVLPVPRADGEPQGESDFLAVLCRENLLLTIHSRSFAELLDIGMLDRSDSWLPECSIAGLLSSILIRLSLECLAQTTRLRRSILELEEQINRDPDSVKAEDFVNLRTKLLSLGSVVSDQLPPVQALSATDKPFFQLKGARDNLNCALVNLEAANGSLEWLDQQISSLRSGFDMRAQEKTNRRLNMLTILSAIFMPITLLASIWGMNFEVMPELKVPFAYPLALGFMTMVGLAMYLFFRRTGWLD